MKKPICFKNKDMACAKTWLVHVNYASEAKVPHVSSNPFSPFLKRHERFLKYCFVKILKHTHRQKTVPSTGPAS